jgi:hypothetical protein
MTRPLVRLYAVVASVLVFFVTWAVVAAHPWQAHTTVASRQLTALDELRRRVRAESLGVQRILDRRFAAYSGALAERRRTIALVESLNARRSAAPAAVPTPRTSVLAPPTVIAPAVAVTRTS